MHIHVSPRSPSRRIFEIKMNRISFLLFFYRRQPKSVRHQFGGRIAKVLGWWQKSEPLLLVLLASEGVHTFEIIPELAFVSVEFNRYWSR